MPAGCSSWPAFWLTDEPNWPVNGEIDILEGVNTQTVVKTALHSTMDCKMDDVPLGVKTGTWVCWLNLVVRFLFLSFHLFIHSFIVDSSTHNDIESLYDMLHIYIL